MTWGRYILVAIAAVLGLMLWLIGPVIDGNTAEAETNAPDMACRAVTLIDRTTGAAVVGPEDIAVDYDANLAYISAYDRRKVEAEIDAGARAISPGGIYRLDLSELSSLATSVTVEDLTQEFKEGADFRPHGIDLQGDQLLAVNRAYISDGESVRLVPTIERFRVEGGGLLAHLETLKPEDDELMCSPNDVASEGGDSFYVTNDHGSCGGFSRLWEDTFALARSHLLYFDGQNFRKVAKGLGYANGLAFDGDFIGGRLVVSETRRQRLAVFDTAALTAPDAAEILPLFVIPVPGSPDNLSRSVDGGLLVGAIPDLSDFIYYRRGWFGVETAASRIVAISLPFSALSEVEVIFEDDGSLISAATVIADARDVRLIGAVLEGHIVVCNKPVAETIGDELD